MQDTWSVFIVYNNDGVRPHICYSQYFRLCGFVVGGAKVPESSNTWYHESRKYLFTLVLNKGILENDTYSENNIFNISDMLLFTKENEGDYALEQTKCRTALKAVLNVMLAEKMLTPKEYEALSFIAKLYVKFSILINEYNCQHYFFNRDVMQSAHLAFQKMEGRLFREYQNAYIYSSEEREKIPFIQFARCYCAGRMQEIEDSLSLPSRFDFYKITNILDVLTRKNSKFLAGYYLQGQLFEKKKKWGKAYGCYREFLEYNKNGFILGDVDYRLGKMVEEMENLKQANPHYEKSYQEDGNYPALYKMGLYEEFVQKDYREAEEIYLGMIDNLQKILESGEMQPQDLEYLFKLYFRCGRLYLRRLPDMHKAQFYFRKAEEIEEIKIEQMKFMKMFYGDEAEQYLQRTIAHYPIYQMRINRQEAEWNDQ